MIASADAAFALPPKTSDIKVSHVIAVKYFSFHHAIIGAPVYSPVDGLKWLKAKQYIQRADFIYAQLLEHLLKTHLLMEPICVIMRRSLSVFHPLHQILKWHCRGLHVVNSLGLKALLNEGEYTHKLFAIGHAGAVELLNRAYPDMSWADTEFDENLKVILPRNVFNSSS